MKIRSDITLSTGVFRATIGLGENGLTGAEHDVLAQLGDCNVEVGGSIAQAGHATFTLPTKSLRFPTDFPCTQLFDLTATAPAGGQRAINWVAVVRERIVAAMVAHAATSRSGIGEQVTTHEVISP